MEVENHKLILDGNFKAEDIYKDPKYLKVSRVTLVNE